MLSKELNCRVCVCEEEEEVESPTGTNRSEFVFSVQNYCILIIFSTRTRTKSSRFHLTHPEIDIDFDKSPHDDDDDYDPTYTDNIDYKHSTNCWFCVKAIETNIIIIIFTINNSINLYKKRAWLQPKSSRGNKLTRELIATYNQSAQCWLVFM